MSDTLRLIHLYQPESDRRIRLEVPTVFGRHDQVYEYTQEHNRFSEEERGELERLDYVEISGDDKISRTHGVLDPERLTIQDLNSTNGIHVNGARVPSTPGQVGPRHPILGGDVLHVGIMQFVVELEDRGLQSLCGQLGLNRQAVLGPVGSPDVGVLSAFLEQRKQFSVHEGSDWRGILEAFEAIRSKASGFGITVVALAAEPEGDLLNMNDAQIRAEALVDHVSLIPGSKVLALQAAGDPSGFERAFEDLAYQDTILVTSTVSPASGLDEGIETTLGTSRAGGVRKAISGEDARSYDSVLDGLDAMIGVDSNVLNVDWVEGYQGALRVVVGKRRHLAVDVEVEMSYRTDLSSSFRVRHHFDSSRFGSDRGIGSAL